MYHVATREFIDSFKSIRSLVIIVFITYFSYESARFFQRHPMVVEELTALDASNSAIYTFAIAMSVAMFGFLFVFTMSHNVINKEIELKTIRLLTTKISRAQIVSGKLLGIMAFWFITIGLSYIIIGTISDYWFFTDFIRAIIFLFYAVGLALLLSTIITKSTLTMFVGVFVGLVLPIVGVISIASNKWYFLIFKYILPYYYLEKHVLYMLIPFIIGLLWTMLTITILNRKDL